MPDILLANASEDLQLRGAIATGLLGLGRYVAVTARCKKHDVEISDPYVGCDLCANERPVLFDINPQDNQ